MQLNLPEVDRDMYNARFDNISAWDFALQKAQKFITALIPQA